MCNPLIHHKRRQLAWEKASHEERNFLYVEEWEFNLSCPTQLLETLLRHDEHADGDSLGHDGIFFWHRPKEWMLCKGHVHVRRAPTLSAFLEANIEKEIGYLAADDASYDLIRMVGGASFEEKASGHDKRWAGYEGAILWVPEWTILSSPNGCVVRVCVSIQCGEGIDALHNALKRIERELEFLTATPHRLHKGHVHSPLYHDEQWGMWREPHACEWEALVDDTAKFLRRRDNPLEKVVLARRFEVAGHFSPRVMTTMIRQWRRAFSSCTLFCIRPPLCSLSTSMPSTLVGATPECLIERDEMGHIYVDALAGTASAHVSNQALLHSAKDRHEHDIVVRHICHELEGMVQELTLPSEPKVDAISSTIKHLRTPIRGRTSKSLLELAARLHPTPAVCGQPKREAMAYIQTHERAHSVTRGWYTGAIGWLSCTGTGRFDVALRCALLERERATIYAGAGIVESSQGSAEREETRLKALSLSASSPIQSEPFIPQAKGGYR